MFKIGHLVAGCALTFATIGLLAAPVHADQPQRFPDSVEFEEPNPCNPEEMQTTTLTLDVAQHWTHPHTTVINIEVAAETDTGFSGRGHQTVVIGPRTYNETLQLIATNTDTGQRYKVNLHLTMLDGTFVVSNFELVCLT
jgi:hypothetical protein